MAEEESDLESERFKEELDCLLDISGSDEHTLQSKNYCSRFCKLVEEHTGRWQVPLPQLQVLRTALCCFTHGTVSFPSDCEHVQYSLSSLALSFFELLLFFGKDEFLEDPLKDILDSFQECHSSLARHKNVYLLCVKQIIEDGGPWENRVLQAILREFVQPHDNVERYLSSEVPAFFEFRVRYLLACERIQEAVALAKSCIQHPTVGRRLYFHQVYLTCLWKASLYGHLKKEMAVIDGRDAVEIICNTESEEKDDLLLALCKEFLTQQLQNGDMYYLWDLVFIWSKLHLRSNSSKHDLMEECQELMSYATNVKSIFPFMKVVRTELGNEGLQFCVELCARVLQMDLHHDPVTKSLIYKTIAYLLPTDLEVCRACALLVFFLERTLESYKTAFLLYTCPDQEYHADCGLIKNQTRFEILQVLKKGLYFDPEFWNLITLRTNCLKLMSEKVLKAALNETMEEDKWIPNDCVKEPYRLQSYTPDCNTNQVIKHHVKDTNTLSSNCTVVQPETTAEPIAKRRGRKPGSKVKKVLGGSQLRRSFRQLDMAQENSNKQHGNRQRRHLARQVEKKTLKRRGRKPHWLLQEAARQVENSAPRRRGRLGKKIQFFPSEKLPELALAEMSKEKDKVLDISLVQAGCSMFTRDVELVVVANEDIAHPQEEPVSVLTIPLPDNTQISPIDCAMLEVSLPDNEVMDSFSLEQEVEMLYPMDNAQQDADDASLSALEVHVAQPFREPCEKEMDFSVRSLGVDHLSALLSELKNEAFEELVIPMDNPVATLQELHNYSKIPEEAKDVLGFLGEVPKEAPSLQWENSPDISEQMENTLMKKEITPQTSVDTKVSSNAQAEVAEPDLAPKAIDVDPEESVLVNEPYEIPLEMNVPDNTVSIPDTADVSSSQKSDLEVSVSTNKMIVDPDNTTGINERTPNSPGTIIVSKNISSVPSFTTCFQNASLAEQMQPPALSQAEVSATDLPSDYPKTANHVFKHRCRQCNKEFRGGNIMRHAVAHLQKDKLKCMFCGQLFKRRLIAKKHVAEHIEELKTASKYISAHKSKTTEALKYATQCLPRNGRNKKSVTCDGIIPSDRKLNSEEKDLLHSEKLKMKNSRKATQTVQKVNGSIEKGKIQCGRGEYSCPGDGCEKMFVRNDLSLFRHAIKSHPDDTKVQEYAFNWRKGKCQFCKRQLLSLQHYLDHVKRHDHSLKHGCLHHDCKDRFKTQKELKGHMKIHRPLQAQCGFENCSKRFNHLSQLHNHELRHYPLSEIKDVTLQTHPKLSGIQEGKEFKASQNSSICDYEIGRESLQPKNCTDRQVGIHATESNEKIASETNGAEKHLSTAHMSDTDERRLNGHVENVPESDQGSRSDIRDVERMEPESKAGLQEPPVQGHKGVKEAADRAPYGGTSNRPFVRPPPPTYLDEKFISMPKRRKSSTIPIVSPAKQSSPDNLAQRQRCTKCFSTFSSAEELQSHLSLNRCTSLFGFDSDEEGAW